MRALPLLVATLALSPALARADEPAHDKTADALGGAGESCRARSDCRPGLKCVASVCRSEKEGQTCGATSECGDGLKCIAQVCVTSEAGARKEKDKDRAEEKPEFDRDVAHPYLGLRVVGGGGFYRSHRGGSNAGGGSVLISLVGGVTLGRFVLEAEVTPAGGAFGDWGYGIFQGNGSVGVLARLGRHVSWPIKVGVGGGFVYGNGSPTGVFDARADLFGLLIDVPAGPGAVFIELHFPTFRYYTEFQTWSVFTWLLGFNVGYAF